MKRRRFRAILVLVAMILSACSIQDQGSAQVEADEDVPFGLLDRDAPPLLPTASAPATRTVSLCFVEHETLVSVTTPLRTPVDLTSAVDALSRPPESASASLRTAIGGAVVKDVRLAEGVARVDLEPAITELGGDEQLLAVAQLVCTLTDQPGVGLVTFTLDGTPVDVPRSDGSLTSGPVSREDYADLVP